MSPIREERGKWVHVKIYATPSGVRAIYLCNHGHQHDTRAEAAFCSREFKSLGKES